MKIAVVGDIILDRTLWGTFTRISPEDSDCKVLDQETETQSLGGAGNVAAWLTNPLNVDVDLFGHYASDWQADAIEFACRRKGIILREELFCRSLGHHTTVKERFFLMTDTHEEGRQLLRVDRDTNIKSTEEDLDRMIDSNLDQFDAIVVADYGKGVFQGVFGEQLQKELSCLHSLGIPLFVNSKYPGRWAEHSMTALIANRAEFRAAFPGLNAMQVAQQAFAEIVVKTSGSLGAAAFPKFGPLKDRMFLQKTHVKPGELRDVTGAGDAFTAGFVNEYLRTEFDHENLDHLYSAIGVGQDWAAHCCRQFGCGNPLGGIHGTTVQDCEKRLGHGSLVGQ